MLELSGVTTFYGDAQALYGIDLRIGEGEVVTLLGRNGMGKTTVINSVMGITPPRTGTVAFCGERVEGLPSFRIAQKGIGLVPEGRQIFPNLTVRENLLATANNRQQSSSPWALSGVLELFPVLQERLEFMGNLLSGGEQQMLAIARALLTNPSLLLLDDATEGLAPLVRQEIWSSLEQLKGRGLSILVVDKNVRDLLRIADRHYVLEQGNVVWQGVSDALSSDTGLQRRYLSV